jgi:prepilin-type N-terminal cleavage/methylation domain-containing protein
MRFIATNTLAPRPLAVEWLEQPDASPAAVALRAERPVFFPCACREVHSKRREINLGRRRQACLRAFTLLELMVVLAIIGFIAAVALPHVSGFNKANTVTAATRQLLDDVARARRRALVNRSTVYMVFLPAYWSSVSGLENQMQELNLPVSPQFNNLLMHQYAGYALYSSRTVGDQPGQNFPHYLTEWQTLPSGIYIWPGQFNNRFPVTIYTTNTLSGSFTTNLVYPFATNFSFYFPSIGSGVQTNLPYIGFTPQGRLLASTNQYIVLSRGSIMYPQGSNGVPIAAPPDVEEAPPGNETNNPCMIKIDWVTARATIVQNQFQ